MCKSFIFIRLITSIMCLRLCYSVPVQKSLTTRPQINPYYLKAMVAYKKLERKLPREELQAITTIGILNGIKQTEQQMEKNLIETIKDLLLNTNMNDKNLVLPKIDKIEHQLQRDQKALEILTKSLDMATKAKDPHTFRLEMLDTLTSLKGATHANANTSRSGEVDVGKRVAQLRKEILKQVDIMKNVVDEKVSHTLDYVIDHATLDGPVAKASYKALNKRQSGAEEAARTAQIKSLLTEDDFRNNLIELPQPESDDNSLEDDNLLLDTNNVIRVNNTNAAVSALNSVVKASNAAAATNESKLAQQQEGSPEFLDNNEQEPAGGGGGGGGGGLVGLITSLSGGEGGSDIGALLGALTGVVGQLFGPGGLDVEGLIGSATSLISGLLSGNKNFGTVLGIYVGTAFDGLSGGGGAINNGQFIGNFLGTVVASLSADPEEETEPPKPLLFIKNLITSFFEAKNRPLTEEESSERKDVQQSDDKAGSDSPTFIKHIVSHIVSTAVNVILNVALGASGGSSQASHPILASSSGSHKSVPVDIRK